MITDIHVYRAALNTAIINMGDMCNLSCTHCHISAGPTGIKNMSLETSESLVRCLIGSNIRDVEFTGGAPELNPCLEPMIKGLYGHVNRLTIRTNLVALDVLTLSLLKRYNVKIIASLPGLDSKEVDAQRGKGVFDSSIETLKGLNAIGYGNNDLYLDIGYNPVTLTLPPGQDALEGEFKRSLYDRFGITFNNLLTMTNVPIGRFRRMTGKSGDYDGYLKLLKDSYNPATIDNLMCRDSIAIDYLGYIYDCDFNLALGMKVSDMRAWEVDISSMRTKVIFGEHCNACMADMGSGCHGSLNCCEDKTDIVRRYYGEELKSCSDLKTSACCSIEPMQADMLEILDSIDPEVRERFYGCGSPIPLHLNGLDVLDVGCGTGRDTFIVSKLVGETGSVTGLDMTDNQIDTAIRYAPVIAERFGFKRQNTVFIKDEMENIHRHFRKDSLDLVISNCVINLAKDKRRVLAEIFDVLKWGGEFYFSDVYADRRLPAGISNDPLLYAECLGGALYIHDFTKIAQETGFTDPRIVSQRIISMKNGDVQRLVGDAVFYSITYRLWKLEGLDEACEDYGHIAIYRGGLTGDPLTFELDGSHIFRKNRPEKVCGNTALMLSRTRFAPFFEVIGDFSEHFGRFDACATVDTPVIQGGSCC